MIVSADQLLGMSKRALDELFRDHLQGEIPSGEGHGTGDAPLERGYSAVLAAARA